MRWPWMSKDAHEQIVAPLRQRLAELDIERKRIFDAYLVALGGDPVYFPDVRNRKAVAEQDAPEAEESTAELDEFDLTQQLATIARTRPSSLPAAFSQLMARQQRRGTYVAPANGNGKAKEIFDKAETEVKERIS